MIKTKFVIIFFIVALIYLFCSLFFYKKDQHENRIINNACKPRGLLNSYRAKIYPKEFWLEQSVLYNDKDIIKYYYDDIEVCADIKNNVKKYSCLKHFEISTKTNLMCAKYANDMFKIHNNK